MHECNPCHKINVDKDLKITKTRRAQKVKVTGQVTSKDHSAKDVQGLVCNYFSLMCNNKIYVRFFYLDIANFNV